VPLMKKGYCRFLPVAVVLTYHYAKPRTVGCKYSSQWLVSSPATTARSWM